MIVQKPKGTLIPIGGSETRKDSKEIFQRIITETGKINPVICVFTLASDTPLQTENHYKTILSDLGIETISFINFNFHIEADSVENLDKVKDADVIIFSDGSQLKLTSLLGGTHLMARIKKRYNNEPGFVVAGVCAGAAAMSNTMIISCSSNDAMLKGELEVTNGLDLINSIFIDTRMNERGRFGCLIQTVTFNPAIIGIGLNEETAAIIKNNEIEVIGTGLITIVDGTSIAYTDLTEIAHGEPITVEGIKVHLLSMGKSFAIHAKQIKRHTAKSFLLERRA